MSGPSTLEKAAAQTLGNEALAHHVIQEAIQKGVTAFCLCPGSRNSPIVTALNDYPHMQKFFLYEERSAAYFALGLARRDRSPVAVVVTSGTAAGELLPATMEGYYTNVPLLLITADRPRRFSGSGAPQSAEQVGLFNEYAPFAIDVAEGEACPLSQWNLQAPAHMNVRFEDPFRQTLKGSKIETCAPKRIPEDDAHKYLDRFFDQVSNPFVVVSTLAQEDRHQVVNFLMQLNAPVLLEGVSGLREDPRLKHLRVLRTDNIWKKAAEAGYPIDGVLRIGGVPTFSGWRDLENEQGKIEVCSISSLPFPGLSWADIIQVSLRKFLLGYQPSQIISIKEANQFLSAEIEFSHKLENLFIQEPFAEASLVKALSQSISPRSQIYLGNSLPIREWDLAATNEDRGFNIQASRGMNGIDGQISTFLGLSRPGVDNWAILGDLTTLYDMPGPWVIPQLANTLCTIVVINNSGGQIFSKFFKDKAFLHEHNLGFEPLANMWGLSYEKWTSIPKEVDGNTNRLIEIVPDNAASERFWSALKLM